MTTHIASPKGVQAELEALRAENARLRQLTTKKLSLKVSEKGAVSMYGLRRFPVTFYAAEWQAISEAMPQIADFIVSNADQLASKS